MSTPSEPVPPASTAAVDLAPMAELITGLTRQNQELAAAAALWQERARFLGERLQTLEAGPIAPPDAGNVQEHASQDAAEAAETRTAAWRRWWRRMTGGAVDLS